MNKFSIGILISGLLSAGLFLTGCTKSSACQPGSTLDSCQTTPNLPPNPSSGEDAGGGSGNTPNPPTPPPVALNPAVDPNYKFTDLNDYCSKLNTYASSSASEPGDKILGCWVLQSIKQSPGAPVQLNVCNFTNATTTGTPFTTCGIYIFDDYRAKKSLGCGIVASVKDSKKIFKVFGDLGFSDINKNWVGSSSLPNLDGFIYSPDLITKTIVSEGNQKDGWGDGGGVLFQNEILTFGRLNPTPNSEDSVIVTNMKANGCTALPAK